VQQRISVHYILSLPDEPVSVTRGMVSGTSVVAVKELGATAVVIPWVESCRWGEIPAVSVTPTQGEIAVQNDPRGTRLGALALAGKIGPLPFDVKNPDGTLRREIADSWAYWDMVLNLLRIALQRYGYANFYALDEGWYYRVVPDGPLDTARGTIGKLSATWALTFKTVGKIKAPTIDYIASAVPPKVAADPTAAAITEAKKEKFSLLGACAKARDAVTSAVGVVTGPVEAVLDYAEDVADEYDEWGNLIVSTAHMPERLVHRAQALADSVISTTDAIYRGTYVYARDRWFGMKQFASGGVVAPMPGTLSRALRDSKAANRTARTGAFATVVASRVSMRRGESERRPVREGDTIQGLAAAALGSPAAWRTLVDENDLRPPYISAAGLPGTLQPGDTILIPAVPGLAPQSTFKAPGDDDDESLYGRDLAQAEDGDLKVRTYSNGVDWDLVRGAECAMQSLRRRLSWERGTNMHFPDHGLPGGIGNANTAAASARFGVDATNEVLSDDRCSRVEDVTVVDGGDGWRYEATAVLVDAEEVLVSGGPA
jgi:hypothetical protein